MTHRSLEHEDARTLRGHWFQYLDTLEPLRPDLHAYCRKLTGTVWDAEDLVQETLLKGFAMTARGDFHGPDSPVRNARAYLFRTATNAWLDDRRQRRRLVPETASAEPDTTDADTAVMAEAIDQARSKASPAEFASLLLKDVYGFTLVDTADFVGTTPGTVKSALHRVRRKLRDDTADAPGSAPADASTAEEERALAAAFAEAINLQDADRILSLMADTLQIVVCNVGGGRGRSRMWTEPTVAAGPTAEIAELDGRSVVILLEDGRMVDVLVVTGSEGMITRLTDYCYAPEVVAEVAERLGRRFEKCPYHQPPDVLPRMIATTTLPWREA